MTIKQQGGIFGRNPTFNDVEVEGNLTVGGSAISEIGTIASQDADSVNIDGGAIDGVTLGLNSAVTQAQIDNININGNSITSTDSNGNIVINPDGTGKVGLNQSSLKADLHLNGSQFIGNTTTGLEISDTSLYISRAVSASLARSIEMTYTYNSGHVGAVFRRVDTSALSALPSSGSVTSDILSMDASTNNVIISNGNLVIGTSGQGIDFSATSGTGTSELFDDYEEGTWTPAQGSGLTVVGAFSSSGTYTKIGRQVTVTFSISGATSIAVSAGGIITTNLPFTVLSGINAAGKIFRFGAAGGECIGANTGVLVYNGAAIAAGGGLDISISYFV